MACLLLALPQTAAAQAAVFVEPDGGSLTWSRWQADHETGAVLLWASWLPDARESLASAPALASLCAERGWAFLLIDVQEEISEARSQLEGLRLPWVNDRHGTILKHHRVTWIPQLLIVDRDDQVLARLQPTVEALRGWVRP
jgi:hypothetical protein